MLRGSCGCGSVGWKARGASAINFVCHCTICRRATGAPYTPAAGFKPEQVEWLNKGGMLASTPPNSRNVRYHCAGCGEYIAEDASRPLGLLVLPLSAVRGGVPEAYRPNHHIFYADRAVDVGDALPKWRTLLQGELMDAGGPLPPVAAAGGAVPPPLAPAPAGGGGGGAYDAATGRFRKDVLPLSPTRPPYSGVYHFTEVDPIANHVTAITPEKVAERVARKCAPAPRAAYAFAYCIVPPSPRRSSPASRARPPVSWNTGIRDCVTVSVARAGTTPRRGRSWRPRGSRATS